MAGDSDNSQKKLVIALDFGTTFSGIAYCFASQENAKVRAIGDWPESDSNPKTPTTVRYEPNDQTKFSWGKSATRESRQSGEGIVGVKLLLDPTQKRPTYLPSWNIKRDIKRLPKQPVEIAADYIRALYNHALVVMENQVPRGYMADCEKDFVLSVPAVWSDAAKDTTLQAGIHPVTLIKEPEAAALWTIRSLGFALDVADAFVMCDARGGTVDLISYEIVSLRPGLELRELVPGNGGMAGSLGLNQRFVEAIKGLIEDDQFERLRKTKGFGLAEDQFDEKIKMRFAGDSDEENHVHFPMADLEDDPELDISSNSWRMKGLVSALNKRLVKAGLSDLAEIFDPLIADILLLTEGQVKTIQLRRPGKPIRGIFLVGGFGSNKYLKDCVEKKGAALSRLPHKAAVVSTPSTRHYGVEAMFQTCPILDAGQPSHRGRNGKLRTKVVTWYIAIGQDLERGQKIRFSFCRDIDQDYVPSDLIFEDKLFECADEYESCSPPREKNPYYPNANILFRTAPRHRSKGKKIGVNFVITTDLSSLKKENLDVRIDRFGVL
ncbi:hypothetical protein OQA88_12429 [Cercophora sp. LCS_1]